MTQQHDAPEGGVEWRLVPVKPTEAMLDAGNASPEAKLGVRWTEMLNAAPTPPAPSGLVDAVKGWRCGLCGCANSPDTGICTRCNTAEMWCRATPLSGQPSTPPAPLGLVDAVRDETLFTPAYGEWLSKAPLKPISESALVDSAAPADPGTRWIDQTRTKDTHPDVRGDCTRAAIASLFALPLDAVPDFNADDPVDFYESIEAFFLSLGYELYRVDRDVAFDALHLASGPAARGVSHSVVRRGTKVVHDPHPSRAGLLSVEFVVVPIPLDPSALLPAQAYRARLQAIMDWVDLAHSASYEFASHGLGLLRGPVFDEARATLSGQQGGAVPAGDDKHLEDVAIRAFIAQRARKEFAWVEDYHVSDFRAHDPSFTPLSSAISTALRARLAEQPAPASKSAATQTLPAGTRATLPNGLVAILGANGRWIPTGGVPEDKAEQPAPAGTVEIDYTNHAGIRSVRKIVPTGRLLPGDDEYHPSAPWVIEAFDPEKGAMRTFDPMHLHRWGDQERRSAVKLLRASLAIAKASGFDLAGTGTNGVEGLRPGLEKALEIVKAELETVSSSSGSYQRLGSVSLALRAALDGASGQEGRS